MEGKSPTDASRIHRRARIGQAAVPFASLSDHARQQRQHTRPKGSHPFYFTGLRPSSTPSSRTRPRFSTPPAKGRPLRERCPPGATRPTRCTRSSPSSHQPELHRSTGTARFRIPVDASIRSAGQPDLDGQPGQDVSGERRAGKSEWVRIGREHAYRLIPSLYNYRDLWLPAERCSEVRSRGAGGRERASLGPSETECGTPHRRRGRAAPKRASNTYNMITVPERDLCTN